MANFGTSRSVVGSYVCAGNDENIFCDATGGAATVTLPLVNAESGRRIRVWKTDASGNAVTVVAPAGYTLVSAIGVSVDAQNEAISMILGSSTVWRVGDEAEVTVINSAKVNGFAITQATAVADVVAAAVTTPANAIYTVGDQTALADAVLEIKGQVNDLLAANRVAEQLAT